MSLTPMALKERFEHRPLIPDALAQQQSSWRQRWGLPHAEVHASSTDWRYYISPTDIVSRAEPTDPRLRLPHALRGGTATAKYFLTGSKGAGKSTTAYSLWQDPEFSERYCLIGCSIADYLNLADFDAGQIIAVMIAHLIATIQDAGRDAELGIPEARAVLAAMDEVLKQARHNVELSQVSVNVFGLLSAQFKESKGLRTAYAEYVDGNFDALMALFDRLVALLESHRKQKVLFIIDDLDKAGSFDINNNIFHVNLPMLLRPRCAVLYTFPLELHHDPRFDRLKAQSNRYVLENIKILDRPGGQPQREGLDILRAFIMCRLSGDALDAYLDLPAAALDRVFWYACGNYRELCRILQYAFETADILGTPRADLACFQAALRQLRKDYNPFLQRYRATLDAVRHNVRGDEDPVDLDREDLGRLIQSLAVVEYPDDPGWLDVHPIVQDLIDGRPSGLADVE